MCQPEVYWLLKQCYFSVAGKFEYQKKYDVNVSKQETSLLYKNLKSLGGWARKSAMADATKTTAHPIGHMTYTQVPAVCEKKKNFHSAGEKFTLLTHCW